ncbi:hypothetical protein MBM_05660 [Drepanopeziza brunnea f. sp. 'multigermtubi' MB_m1]|uniref:MARVEL domain-containing protein n=1 Tax=Marssonina brunnea f. sp. multigermtubi (strain MB_m1) TaxID=1072389 RepID=K1WTH2_MARBU|nr:uncharacterized protein MBM_05660 [Drepanopeziza brunnea f. sp. 'multigermtubi' MB_m1]EKD16366.1 hypothetical protein MBM_05660 [Drepanopeziza brunnea f. sp. 'multigermtubi' MB_m1]
MAKFGGLALKSTSMFLRFVEFACAAVVLGIFTYYLVTLHNQSIRIPTNVRAVEGISGAAVLYTILAVLFVCCLGGIAIFGFIAVLLDLAFCGAFIYVAYVNRHATDSCSGVVTTPYGQGLIGGEVTGNSDGFTELPSFKTACRLQKAAFAVAIIGLVFFFLSMFVEYGLIRHHKREKAFGPSPHNGYTAGSPKRKFWQRAPKTTTDKHHPDGLPTHATPADMRTSYATDATAIGEPALLSKYGPETYSGVGHQKQQPQVYGSQTTNGYQPPTGTTTMGGPQQTGVAAGDGYVPYSNNSATGNY